jgi:hypothetical protein
MTAGGSYHGVEGGVGSVAKVFNFGCDAGRGGAGDDAARPHGGVTNRVLGFVNLFYTRT